MVSPTINSKSQKTGSGSDSVFWDSAPFISQPMTYNSSVRSNSSLPQSIVSLMFLRRSFPWNMIFNSCNIGLFLWELRFLSWFQDPFSSTSEEELSYDCYSILDSEPSRNHCVAYFWFLSYYWLPIKKLLSLEFVEGLGQVVFSRTIELPGLKEYCWWWWARPWTLKCVPTFPARTQCSLE